MAEQKKLIYVFDALCPWCYAFTPVVERLVEDWRGRLGFEALSGGMVVGDRVRSMGGPGEGERLRREYRGIEQRTEARFGEAFFARMERTGLRLDSLPPAKGLAVHRELRGAEAALEFIRPLFRAIYVDGGDPSDDELYRGLAAGLGLDPDDFVSRMARPEAEEAARYDFALVKQLRVDAFPRLFLQTAEDYFHLVSKGYSEFESVQRILEDILG